MQQSVGKHLDQPPPRGRHPPRRFADQPHAHAHPLWPQIFAHAQAHSQHHAAGGERVIGDPIDEVAQFLSQRRDVELFADILQPIVQARIGIGVFGPDHGVHLARPQRHAHDIARLQFHAARHPVGIVLVERDRHQHIDNACR